MTEAQALRLLDALPQGVSLFDAGARLVHANPAFFHAAGVDPAACPPGSPLRDVVRLLAFRGIYGPGDPEAQTEAALAMDRSRVAMRRLRHADGIRGFEVWNIPLPGGGFATSSHEITPLLRAEAEAEARARRVETVLSRLAGGVAAYDAESRIALLNPAFEALTGCPPGSVRPGMTHRDILALQLARGEFAGAEEVEEVAARIERERDRPATRVRQRPGGEVLRFKSHPMPEGGFVVEVDDITALKRAEDEARRRAALLDGVLEAQPHGILVFGPDLRVTMFNAAYARIMEGSGVRIGERLEEIIARRVAEGEHDAATGEAILLRHQDRGGEVTRRTRPNGTVLEVRVLRLPDGGHISVVSDVTALRRAEAEAQARAAMLEVSLASMRHGLAMFGPDRRLLMWNARTPELIGLPPGTLRPGLSWEEVLDAQVAAGVIAPGFADEGKRADHRRPLRHGRTTAHGQVLEVASDPTPDGGWVMSYVDVTEDRRIRAELETARAAAEAASQAKSRFLATMSHELRTPLNAVIGFAEAIAGGERDPARIADYAGAIVDAGRHLLVLIDDILDVARSQAGELPMASEPVEPGALLEGAARALRAAAAQAGLTLVTEMPEGLPQIRGDRRRLHQILVNLLSNAVKFTPAGGRVTLSAGMEEGALAIRVADTGIGIAPEHRAQVFEPFTQIDATLARRFQGSGLGLHLARRLAQGLGARLLLEDPPEGPGIVALLSVPPDRLLVTAGIH